MSTQKQNILRHLPQRPPLVMIDSIVIDANEKAHSTFMILPDNVMVEDGLFNESGLVENMAQTAGSASGMMAEMEGKTPTLGYIGALKNLNVKSLPKAGQTLHTEITFVHKVMRAMMVEGKVFCEGKIIADCELKIFILSENNVSA